MSGPSSPTSPTPLAFYDPESWSWRTSQGCLLSAAPESLERLPDWGTTSDGVLYEHRTPALLTAARDGSALLGTPTRDNAVRSERFKRKSPNMGELAALLPTPTSQAAKHGSTPDIHANGFGSNLWDLPHLLPTPTSVESKVFGPNVDWEKRLSNHAIHIASVLMVKPWLDGDESSDGPHLTQLTTEGCDPDSSSG